jgi:branched-chain amino acid transport system ATP-binding protein
VARTFQISKLFPHMTVLENVLLPALAALDRGGGRPLSEIRERGRALLEFVTMDRMRHAEARELSGGQSMLVQIARALMVEPLRLVLMDEPFAGVHPAIRDIIMEAILRMNRDETVTFLIVSHEMAELRRLCQRVTVMDDGRRIAEGTLEEVANDPLVLEAYLGG